ncbi:RagB/SusD family nutrient uptake outer membrane protein [Echinicola jeungdonensis]|uniref:RagB/SusD family nutrient uptake outer membrane protein n=1 Tax=Echinicola jeungdonensis TaxID=709343 RepID=A0ABV5J9L6_9BACT|nr:RagB/SusD family nutrient uptake outer membrane protein [Echinicola jeungdonensis]MDN3670387.1 RagB/SusD family nutrient uptake outer membrane protein [Echinicola jeungdonensis]
MKINLKIGLIITALVVVAGCSDLIDPAVENIQSKDNIRERPGMIQGLLLNAYLRIPTNGYSFSEMATDDAVSNDLDNGFLNIATGQWASNNNPLDRWSSANSAIQYLNEMLVEVGNTEYASNPRVNQMFMDRLTGETYGLRALFMYYLLQAHGGISEGELLGVPIFLEPQTVDSDFNIPRATFAECMAQIYSDIEKAMDLLPMDYYNISDASLMPSRYREAGTQLSEYNRVFGDDAKQLVSGRIVRAIRAQVALLAASPSFNLDGDQSKWTDAATYAGNLLNTIGGVSGLDPNGVTWYNNTSVIDGLGAGNNPPEILWRGSIGGPSNNLESRNFPPTLYGDGLVNPTQNLVDAFPMANGYPISDPASGYSDDAPYANRDRRLAQFIILNGSTAGPTGTTINTALDSDTNDGLNKVETSTRTGYYMRKLLRQDVNLDPVANTGQRHIQPRIRYTEIFLIYAEAANEAWGPMASGSFGFSAYDVIKAIRERAGIGTDNGDTYLESIKSDQEAMRELIRNERRLELSFEGFRFWDLRRWGLDLTETAQGIRIENGDDFSIIDVENRVYQDYMIYGPVPYSERLKFSALQQNRGW